MEESHEGRTKDEQRTEVKQIYVLILDLSKKDLGIICFARNIQNSYISDFIFKSATYL